MPGPDRALSREAAVIELNWNHPEISAVIRLAVAEDVGSGDVTTEACVPAADRARGVFLAREPMTVAGSELLREIFAGEELELLVSSGDPVEHGAVIARVSGLTRRLLTLERTALNFLQRLSGIATAASRLVGEVAGTGCRVLDTRKTTPGLRRLEKLATRAGGVTNHRMGLYDAVLIKNNHIAAAGGVRQALERCRGSGLPVEVEVRTREELDEALDCGAQHLLLDNMSPEQAAASVAHVAGRAKIEISGGITLSNARAYAESGADFISSGAITHSARAMDISFRLE